MHWNLYYIVCGFYPLDHSYGIVKNICCDFTLKGQCALTRNVKGSFFILGYKILFCAFDVVLVTPLDGPPTRKVCEDPGAGLEVGEHILTGPANLRTPSLAL